MTATVWVDQISGWTARTGVASHLGYYRENNEDFVHIDEAYPFALVLDGMGGQAAGELASQRGAEAVSDALRRGLEANAEPRALIEQAMRAGHDAVRELGESNCEYRNCGTTIVLTLLHRGVAYISWLGDSPAYRISNGKIEKLTWEHDLRNALVRNGTIAADEANSYSIRNILWRYLGSEESKEPLEIVSFTPRQGDQLLLATDGITNVVSPEQMLEVCEAQSDPHACAEELVNRALEQGSRDNCSCAVVTFDWSGEGPAPEEPPAQPARKWWQIWK